MPQSSSARQMMMKKEKMHKMHNGKMMRDEEMEDEIGKGKKMKKKMKKGYA